MKFNIVIFALIGCVTGGQLSSSYLPPAEPQPQYLPPAPEPQYLPPAQPQPQYIPPAAPQQQYIPPAPQPQYLPPAPEYLPPVDQPAARDGYRYRAVKKYRLRSH